MQLSHFCEYFPMTPQNVNYIKCGIDRQDMHSSWCANHPERCQLLYILELLSLEVIGFVLCILYYWCKR